MTPENPLVDFTARIDLYLDLWERRGTDEFTVETLPRELGGTGDTDLQGQLDDLVALGLLDWHGEDRYQLRLAPNGSVDEWFATTAERVETIHDAVQDARRQRTDAPAVDGENETLSFEGEPYLRRAVSDDESFEQLAPALVAMVERSRAHSNVALCCPADEADHVQRLADRLTDPDEMADVADGRRFEKVTTQVLGPDPEDLEYRTYLTRRDQ